MKIMKILLVLISILVSFVLQTKASDKGIKVEIKHNNQLIYDTVLNENDEQAKQLIETLVARFSKDSIKLESENVHGLYVFHIDNEQWKSEDVPSNYTDEAWAEENYLNSDSLLNELSYELNSSDYQGITIEMAVDSVIDAFSIIGKAFRTYDFSEDEDLNEIKNGFSNFVKQVKTTKVVLIREEN